MPAGHSAERGHQRDTPQSGGARNSAPTTQRLAPITSAVALNHENRATAGTATPSSAATGPLR
ncbi:hypothetical protein BJF90_04125 [Pseudonocardia sp. CNS-004]|nr:hypothetical protein BJF90_04125 [Pseudonocardia sp. CNS-004]